MKKSNAILIVGLGNPGEKYANSPHNAGFLVVDQLGMMYDSRFMIYEKLKSEIAEAKIDNIKIILAKPQTFMNKSGEAVKLLVTSYHQDLPKGDQLSSRSPEGRQIANNLWVIHDDIDLALGKIKIVKNRGSAGHRGVEDIIQKLGAKEFVRFRIGVRPSRLPQKRSQLFMNKFVTAKLQKEENEIFKKSIEQGRDAILFALENGVEKTASIYNAK